MGMEDGSVTKWFKAVGDIVTAGEPLVEVEAAKVTGIVEAPTSGMLKEILVHEGETVPVREVLARIESA
jgi:pyruvate/2-oxoglutarate dehydrogenase complex dihydrolipoamide acyltransferase (E2) component